MSTTTAALGQQLVERGFLLPEQLQGTPPGASLETEEFLLKLAVRGHLTKFQVKAISRGQIDTLCFGPYVILDMVGRGGMSVIFRARHRHMQRLVALKVISPEIEKDPVAVQRFWREVRVIAQLDHPHIVKAYDAGEESGKMYLAMELIQGINCGDLVKGRGSLRVPQALKLVSQAASGLGYAHSSGIVHRDVKPTNLFVNDKGLVKVLDLGLALLQLGPAEQGSAGNRTDLTRTGIVMGTVDYIAPEQARGKRDLDGRADIYSLGCTLYFLLTGQRPYSGENVIDVILGHMNSPVPSLAAAGVECPPAVQDLLNGMMEKDRGKRFATMEQVVEAITAIRGAPVIPGKVSGTYSQIAPDVQTEPLTLAPSVVPAGPRKGGKKEKGAAVVAPATPPEGAAVTRPKSDSIPSFMEIHAEPEPAPPRWSATFIVSRIATAVAALVVMGAMVLFFQPWRPRAPLSSSASPPVETMGLVNVDLAGDLTGIELAIDGTAHPIAQTLTLTLDPGRHEIVASRRGEIVKQHVISLKAGQRLAVVLDLRASDGNVQKFKIR